MWVNFVRNFRIPVPSDVHVRDDPVRGVMMMMVKLLGSSCSGQMRCGGGWSPIYSSRSGSGMWLLCLTLLAQFTNGLIEGHVLEKEKQGGYQF